MNSTHTRTGISATLGLLLLAGSACANRPTDEVQHVTASKAPAATAPSATAPVVEVRSNKVAIERRLHAAPMSEVVLDAGGTVALTLDTEGDVRLWSEPNRPKVQVPLALPVFEPAWMSVAPIAGQGDDPHYLVAFVDTAGGASVGRVEGNGASASYEPLFDLPATDPQFEAYALEGGRILTLGQDHRIRLFDTQGNMLSAIDETGFVPWQLRVSERPGEAPSIAAVLASPTRVQPIELRGGKLSHEGPARTIELDRGPNRNDVILSPDGRSIAALRRPRARGTTFTIEIIELETDARRLLVGDTDNRKRPRLHWVDDDRMLAENGEGQGLWLSLRDAKPWVQPTDREHTEDLAADPMTRVGLPHSSFVTRPRTAVHAGLRVVPDGRTLVVDSLDDEEYLSISATEVRPWRTALDTDGNRVAWSLSAQVLVDDLNDPGAVQMHESAGGTAVELAFVDDDHLLRIGGDGVMSLFGADDGESVLVSTLAAEGVGEQVVYRRAPEGGLLLTETDRRRSTPKVLAIGPDGWSPGEPFTTGQRPLWPSRFARFDHTKAVFESIGYEGITPHDVSIVVADSQGRHYVADDDGQPVLHQVADGEMVSLPLRTGRVRHMAPDPTGNRLAVVQVAQDRNGSETSALSLYDVQQGTRMWTRAIDGFSDLDWSGNGARVAVASAEGGLVFEAADGELAAARRHLGLKAQRLADPLPTQE